MQLSSYPLELLPPQSDFQGKKKIWRKILALSVDWTVEVRKERPPPPYKPKAPLMGESRITTRAFYKKNTIFPDFRHAMSLRILSTFDSRAFRRI